MIEPINDGGPAFPQWDGHAITSEPMYLRGGMSLRDHFAGQAMARINWKGDERIEDYAQACYALADAMIAQRDKKP